MALFIPQAEYESGQYAGLGDDAFVRAVYTNVLERTADAPGLAFWTDALAKGLPRSEMLAAVALGQEHKALVSSSGTIAAGGRRRGPAGTMVQQQRQ